MIDAFNPHQENFDAAPVCSSPIKGFKADTLANIAFEPEFRPDNQSRAADRGKMSDRVSDITVTSIARMPLRDDEPVSNRVWLKTKGVNYKEYQIYLTDEAIVFSRPKSAKQ